MEKECRNMKVTEIDDGIKIEITGKDIKDKCKVMMQNCCCDEESVQKIIKSCCKPEEK
ncbi:MAG: hypothetical protein HOG24_06990 [Candidatus Cloacimonetes bacterium]|nr:hypothetical protein [Candidatus Cloacimonadota bacterium]